MPCRTLPVLLLTACAAQPRDRDWQLAVPRSAPAVWAAREPWLPPLDENRIAAVGDRASYEVVQHTGDEPRRWVFDLELVELPPVLTLPIPADPMSGRVRTDRGHWQSIGGSDEPVGCSYRGAGKVRIAMHDPDRHARVRTVATTVQLHVAQSDVDQWVELGLVELLNLVLRVDFAHERLLDVVRRPSLASVLTRLGRVDITVGFPEAGRERLTVRSPFGDVPAVWIPMALEANGEPALDCRVLLTWKRWPLQLSGGVLCLEGCHPDAPERRVTVRLRDAGGAPGRTPSSRRRDVSGDRPAVDGHSRPSRPRR
ncbi:MAG: hypothetical protein NXI31_22615 [bacterium]|nr:hypothetical protein [bacterium]